MLFNQWRREILQKLALAREKSPKGSIDAPIVDLIDSVNQNPDYVRSPKPLMAFIIKNILPRLLAALALDESLYS